MFCAGNENRLIKHILILLPCILYIPVPPCDGELLQRPGNRWEIVSGPGATAVWFWSSLTIPEIATESPAAHPFPELLAEFGRFLCSSRAWVIKELFLKNCCRWGSFLELLHVDCESREELCWSSVSPGWHMAQALVGSRRWQRHCQLCADIPGRAELLTLHLLSLCFDN